MFKLTAGLLAGILALSPIGARAHHISGANRVFQGTVTVEASGHKITVASHLADRWKALIADFAAHGYKPRSVGCFATGGHVTHSRHYVGAACDFDQRGWGLTVPFMYRAREIIRAHGFRDGCDFKDCGHVDDGLPGRRNSPTWQASYRTGHRAIRRHARRTRHYRGH